MTVIKTDRFDAQRNRLADLEAPTPATEQYEHWDASESGTYRLSTGQFLLASVVVMIGAIALVL